MFRTLAATATLIMMLAQAGAQHLGNHAANPYVLGGASNATSRPAPTPNPPPRLSDSRPPIFPYDPDVTNENHSVYSPDGTRNPYGAGNVYSPTATTNPYAKPRTDKH